MKKKTGHATWMGASNGTANPKSSAGKVKAKQDISKPGGKAAVGVQAKAMAGVKGYSKPQKPGKLGC